jgi:7-cyano-7-deazaguanine synthase
MNVLLLSGGIESTCVAFWKRPDRCVTINYGQVCANTEIEASASISAQLRIPHTVLEAPLNSRFGLLGGGCEENKKNPEFWPFRNQYLAIIAAMAFYHQDVREIWFGSVSTDIRFRDGSLKFFQHLDALFSWQEGHVRVKTPAIKLTAAQLVRKSKTPRRILGATFSCHRAELACGDCPGCLKHRQLLYSGTDPRSAA